MNYNNRKFKVLQNTDNGEVSNQMIFEYSQINSMLTCTYKGGQIELGHLIGIVADDGSIDMKYHQVNKKGILLTGICKSTPELLVNGKLRLHEAWQWTNGDMSKGQSVLEEI